MMIDSREITAAINGLKAVSAGDDLVSRAAIMAYDSVLKWIAIYEEVKGEQSEPIS